MPRWVRTAERPPRRAPSDRSRLNLSLTTQFEEMIRVDTQFRLEPVRRSMPTLQWQMSYRAPSSTFTGTSVCASRESSHRTLRDSSSRAMLAVPSHLIGGSPAMKRHCIHIAAGAAAGAAAVAVALLGRCSTTC